MSDEVQNAEEPRKPSRDEKRRAKSASRLAAVQALYQIEMTGDGWRAVQAEFETHRLGAEIEGEQYVEADRRHFRALLEGVVMRQREIDQLSNEVLAEGWPLKKIDPTVRAILRSGGCELAAMSSVPARVAISEYVDVAKAFFSDRETPRFVNAVLDAMARRLRPDELERRAEDGSDRGVAS